MTRPDFGCALTDIVDAPSCDCCPLCGGEGKVSESWLRAHVLAPGANVCDGCGAPRRTAYYRAQNICAVCWEKGVPCADA